MSEEEESSGDKPFEATQRKLDQARTKGDFARSTDLNTSALYLGLIAAGITSGSFALRDFSEVSAVFLGRASDISDVYFSGSGGPVLAPIMLSLAGSLATFFIFPIVFVSLSIAIQRGFVFAPSKLHPKISRISLTENLKNKFGSRGLFEFAKSTVKLIIYTVILIAYLQFRFDEIISTIVQISEYAVVNMLQYTLELLAVVFCISLVMGGIDYLWQRFEHLKKQRMSYKEMRDELKDTEGDPYLKQTRRRKAEEVALNSMLTAVPQSDVVIVNPTHYAVALKWSREGASAPECVAKGTDEIAMRIREIAKDSRIPIHRDPPTARALFATLEVGQEIRPEHYQAVAAAIRFSDSMRSAARKRPS